MFRGLRVLGPAQTCYGIFGFSPNSFRRRIVSLVSTRRTPFLLFVFPSLLTTHCQQHHRSPFPFAGKSPLFSHLNFVTKNQNPYFSFNFQIIKPKPPPQSESSLGEFMCALEKVLENNRIDFRFR